MLSNSSKRLIDRACRFFPSFLERLRSIDGDRGEINLIDSNAEDLTERVDLSNNRIDPVGKGLRDKVDPGNKRELYDIPDGEKSLLKGFPDDLAQLDDDAERTALAVRSDRKGRHDARRRRKDPADITEEFLGKIRVVEKLGEDIDRGIFKADDKGQSIPKHRINATECGDPFICAVDCRDQKFFDDFGDDREKCLADRDAELTQPRGEFLHRTIE